MKVRDGKLVGARAGESGGRAWRIPSERSDVAMLTAALAELCDQVGEVLGPPGTLPHLPLRRGIYAARAVVYRAVVNRDHRDEREKRKKQKAARARRREVA